MQRSSMAPTPAGTPKPNIQKSTRPPGNPHQPPVTFVPTPLQTIKPK